GHVAAAQRSRGALARGVGAGVDAAGLFLRGGAKGQRRAAAGEHLREVGTLVWLEGRQRQGRVGASEVEAAAGEADRARGDGQDSAIADLDRVCEAEPAGTAR